MEKQHPSKHTKVTLGDMSVDLMTGLDLQIYLYIGNLLVDQMTVDKMSVDRMTCCPK